MYALYRIHVDELDDSFLETLKKMFKHREIEISVCEAAPSEEDETAYLLRSPANRERLLKAIENVSERRDLATIDVSELR
jgi:antitoxin YefM